MKISFWKNRKVKKMIVHPAHTIQKGQGKCVTVNVRKLWKFTILTCPVLSEKLPDGNNLRFDSAGTEYQKKN